MRTTSSTSTSRARTRGDTATRAAPRCWSRSSVRWALMHELRGAPELDAGGGDRRGCRPATSCWSRATSGRRSRSSRSGGRRSASRCCTRTTRTSSPSRPTTPARSPGRPAGASLADRDAIATFVVARRPPGRSPIDLTAGRRSRLNLPAMPTAKAMPVQLDARAAASPDAEQRSTKHEDSDTFRRSSLRRSRCCARRRGRAGARRSRPTAASTAACRCARRGTEGAGVSIGGVSSAWGRFTDADRPTTPASRALFFGGYRWANDVSVEAAFAHQRQLCAAAPSGVGPRRRRPVADAPRTPASHAWNADVYTSWSFLRRFALYGRLGYAQSDAVAGLPLLPARGRAARATASTTASACATT